MGAGGWNLVHMWLTDGILAKNWALIQELLELLLLCPVDIERLKSNNCPKLIKGLSKEGSHQGVRTLASRLVEQWLKMVKGEATPTVAAVQATIPSSIHSTISQNSVAQCLQPNASITPVTSQSINSENAVTVQSSDLLIKNSPVTQPIEVQQQTMKTISPQKTQLQISTHALDKQQTVSTSISPSSVYKITIRDGKKVLTQVQTDAANINAISVSSLNTEVNGDVDNVLPTEDEQKNIVHSESIIERISADHKNSVDEVSKETSSEVKENAVSFKNVDETDNIKNKDRKDEKDISSDGKSTSDKENRDKKDDKKSVSNNASSDKKSSSHTLSSNKSSSKHSSSSSKHSSSKHSSSSHRSSSRNSSSSSSSRDKSSKDKEKDKHHSSSSSKSSSSKSKTERDKEKEKEKLKKDQAEKDKATLEKLQSQALSTKMGKIPKKKADEEKSEDSSSRKSSTDSKDSFKENKDKTDLKKVATVAEKKNISISIENRKNSQDQTSRPKTVKTFNSKFRSTGLEEEVKPPPHRGAKKSVSATDKKVLPPKLPTLKRPSPLRESGATPDKKAKFSLDTTNSSSEEKKGGIKLIPAKPKCTYISLIFFNTYF
jgi:protein phosphatase 1 regulatory subunit 10